MAKHKQGLKASIDWSKVEERAEMAVVYFLLSTAGGLLVVAAGLFVAGIACLGVGLASQGLWGIGIPVLAAGAVIAAAVLVLLFAKLMDYVRRRTRR